MLPPLPTLLMLLKVVVGVRWSLSDSEREGGGIRKSLSRFAVMLQRKRLVVKSALT